MPHISRARAPGARDAPPALRHRGPCSGPGSTCSTRSRGAQENNPRPRLFPRHQAPAGRAEPGVGGHQDRCTSLATSQSPNMNANGLASCQVGCQAPSSGPVPASHFLVKAVAGWRWLELEREMAAGSRCPLDPMQTAAGVGRWREHGGARRATHPLSLRPRCVQPGPQQRHRGDPEPRSHGLSPDPSLPFGLLAASSQAASGLSCAPARVTGGNPPSRAGGR